VYFDVAIDQRQCILSGVVIANSRADASLVVVEKLDTTSMKYHTLWAAMLLGAFVISAADFFAISITNGSPTAVLQFIPAVKFWRRVFITDMINKNIPSLSNLCAKCVRKLTASGRF
jgi:hypothetical protein